MSDGLGNGGDAMRTQALNRICEGPAVRIFCVLALMLVQGTTIGAKLEASERPSEVDTATGSSAYRLAPGDKLGVLVFDQAQLSGDFVIDGDGQVLLPLAGTVTVGGLTLGEAQQLIQERFAD